MKRKSKIIAGLLTVALILGEADCLTDARESSGIGYSKNKAVEENILTCGKFLYKLDETQSQAVITGYLEDENEPYEVLVPEEVDGYPVVRIRAMAFQYKKLACVKIPYSVSAVGDYAFQGCDFLEKVEFSEGLEYLGIGSFIDCNSIREVEIPSSVKIVGCGCFSECKNLQKVILNEGIEQIESTAFSESCDLREIEIPDSVKFVGDYAFSQGHNAAVTSREQITIRSMDTEFRSACFWARSVQVRAYRGSTAEKKYKRKYEKRNWSDFVYLKPDLSEKRLQLEGEQEQPLILYGANKKVQWKVKDKTVAQITKNYGGKKRNILLKGVGKGTTTVTATMKGKRYVCKVKVK